MSFIKKLLNEFAPAKTLLKKPKRGGPGVATRTVRSALAIGVGTRFARRAITKEGIPVTEPKKAKKKAAKKAANKKPTPPTTTLTPSQTKKKAKADEYAAAPPKRRREIAAEHPNREGAAEKLAADLRPAPKPKPRPAPKKKLRNTEEDELYRQARKMEFDDRTPSEGQKAALGRRKVKRYGQGKGELVEK